MIPAWVIVTGDFSHQGGMDKANLALARYAAEQGAVVHLVAHRIDAELARHPHVRSHLVPRPLGSHLLGRPCLHRAGRRVAREVLAAEPRARIVVNGGNCAWPDINWVHMVHRACRPCDRGAPLAFRLKNRLMRADALRTERNSIAQARLVFANSQRTRRDLLERLNVEPDRVHVVYLGCDPLRFGPVEPAERDRARARFGLPPGQTAVAFAGALGFDANKGLDTLLAAWRLLAARTEGWDREAVLLAAGGGALEYWKRRAAQSGAGAHVRLLGFSDEIPEVLAAADLFVSPTRYDAYGLNVQEALCRGLPAIVSRCAGVAEQVPPELAPLILEDPENAEELAQRMTAWYANRPAWAAHAQATGQRLRAWTWEHMAAEMVRITCTKGSEPRP